MDDIQKLIDAAHAARPQEPRPHFGCSSIGHPCDRWLWLSWRWAVVPVFEGRILRLFRRGTREEATVVDDLRAIGMHITHTGPEQKTVDFGHGIKGSLDGVIEKGVPGAPTATPHILEVKTHNKRSFDKLTQGIAIDAPMHWAQMQAYMLGSGLHHGLYVAVCKDDDRIYTERVTLDEAKALALVDRAMRIVQADRMPEPLSADPTWYQCKMCAAHDLCHGSKTTKQVNCRTCANATATPDGWRCERYEADGIPVEYQRQGCDAHVLHPDLVPWQRHDSAHEWIAVYEIGGNLVANGETDACVFSSRELLANPDACASGDPLVTSMRQHHGGQVVG